MDTNNNNTMDPKRHDDFQTIWNRRKQDWQEQAEKTLPDDAALLHLAELAQQQAQQQETVDFPITRRRKRWIPYAAAASLVAGVAVIGLTRQGQPENELPVAEEVTVENQTIHFVCNNGCTVQDIMLLANKVIK